MPSPGCPLGSREKAFWGAGGCRGLGRQGMRFPRFRVHVGTNRWLSQGKGQVRHPHRRSPRLLADTDLLPVPAVLLLPECSISAITECLAF